MQLLAPAAQSKVLWEVRSVELSGCRAVGPAPLLLPAPPEAQLRSLNTCARQYANRAAESIGSGRFRSIGRL